jgi:hypothetical protein
MCISTNTATISGITPTSVYWVPYSSFGLIIDIGSVSASISISSTVSAISDCGHG